MPTHKDVLTTEEAASYFWSLVEANALPIMTWSDDGKILTANKAFLEMLNFSKLDLEKKGLSWKEHIDEHINKEIKEKKVSKGHQRRYKKKDGSSIKVTAYHAKHEYGDNQGIAIIIPLHQNS